MCKQRFRENPIVRLPYFILIIFGLHFSEKKSQDMRYCDLEGQSATIVCGRNNNSQMMYYNVQKKVIHFGLVLGIQTNKGQELMILGFCGLITWHIFEFRFRGCLSLEKIDFGLKNIPQ